MVCGAAPGYIVPRLQALVMNEAARMVEEGVATAEEIDKATRYGMGLRFAALGVVEFIDFGGCDILHHASREMAASIDAARYAAPAIVGRMMREGRLGSEDRQRLLRLRRPRRGGLPARRAGAHARHAAPRRPLATACRSNAIVSAMPCAGCGLASFASCIRAGSIESAQEACYGAPDRGGGCLLGA